VVAFPLESSLEKIEHESTRKIIQRERIRKRIRKRRRRIRKELEKN